MFLRELHLIIHQGGNLNTVLEVYTFRFTYSEDGNVLLEMGVERGGSRAVTQADIKKGTVSLLQTLLDHTQGLPPLPDNCFLTVDLTYYDEKVPVDYQPEGFKESAILQVPSGADKFECGSVSTNYHALALQVVKVAEEGPSVQRRALDEHVDADVQGGQTLEDAAGEVAEGGGANEGLICTDPKLVKLATKKPERVGDVCTYRRMLAILLTEEFGNLHELVSRLGIEQDYGEQLFRKLSEDGVISSGDGNNFMIYQENLEKAMGKRFGGKWKEGAAEVKSQPPNKEGKGEDEVTNTAGAENEGQHDHDGSRKFGQG